MLLNQTSAPFTLTKTLHNAGVCRQYLRYKVGYCIAFRSAKRQYALASINWLRLLAGCATAGLLLCTGASHAAEKGVQQKSVAMPIDLIELLGELGDDEADLNAAMSSVERNPAAKKLPQTKPIDTENSNTGAKK